MIHRLMFKPCLSDKYSQSCTNLKYPHFNTERTRRSSMVVGGILYLFNWRCLRYCTRLSNASWTTLASNLVSIDQLVIELWSKAAGHTVAESAMVHGVELCVGGVRCCVLCVCQKSVDVEVPKRAIWGGEANNLCLVYPTYIVWYQSTMKDSVLKAMSWKEWCNELPLEESIDTIYWTNGLFKMKKLIWIWIRLLEITSETLTWLIDGTFWINLSCPRGAILHRP